MSSRTTPELIGGYVQSLDPEMYQLTPVPDWVLEVVPAEEPGEPSPLLYSEDLACEEVRVALNALVDTAVESRNGSEGTVVSYDLSLMDEDKFDLALGGVQIIRDNPNLPQEIRLPAIDFLRNARLWVEISRSTNGSEGIGVENTTTSKDPRNLFEQEIDQQLSAAGEYCAERGTDAELDLVRSLMGELRPITITDGKVRAISATKKFDRTILEFVKETIQEPQKLIDLLSTVLDIDAFTRDRDPEAMLLYGLNGIFSGLTERFENITYQEEDFKEGILRWLSLYEELPSDRYFQGEQDRRAELNDPDTRMKALFLTMEYAALSAISTVTKKTDHFKRPEEGIQSMHELVSACVGDLNWTNKMNFCVASVREIFKRRPLLAQYIKSSPDLKAPKSAATQGLDLLFVLPEIGVDLEETGFSDIINRGLPDRFTERAFLRALPSHKDLIDKRIPLEERQKRRLQISGQIMAARQRFIDTYIDGVSDNGVANTLYGKVRASGKRFVPVKSLRVTTNFLNLPQDA